MKALLLIPLLLIPYLLYIYWRYGMTVSISATAKHHRSTWESVWFALSLWAVGIPLMIVGFEVSNPDSVLILWLLAGGFICLIGAAQVFWKGGMEYKAHMTGSYGGIGAGMLALLIHCTSVVTIALVSLFVVFAAVQMIPWKKFEKYKIQNRIYWVEVSAIVTAQLALLLA
ncbi:hypothetical protein [Maribellus mangrovi]|uniref:hypothetical protein n=1 Tax=Maribellus mangrovi TaxID=3133146 RepID=UPI0030EE6F14